MEKDKSTTKRYRTYATVVYPESAPENWKQIIADAKVPVAISPLHDSDKNPTGEPKKPHYHVLVCYEAPKAKEQVISFIGAFKGVGCEVVQSRRGYARYLCHLDNPEKQQYSPDDVVAFGGCDYMDMIGLPIDRYKAIEEMMDFCDERGLISFATLCRYARQNRRDWFRSLCDSSTYVIKEYLKSCEWERTTEGGTQ